MTPKSDSPAYRTYVMCLLVVVYTFNFIDRQIIGILAIPIKADLGLSDTQLGLMGGLAFALFYTGLGIPIALLADRKSRTWIMTIALATWSAMTALCGLAQNFWQLFLARLGVGVGEAGGVAPAYSLIADLFPSQQRARAIGVFSFGIPIGSALGIIFGGIIATKIDWRYAFFVVGIAGLLLAPIFRLTVREPKRGAFDDAAEPGQAASLKEILHHLVTKRSFWLISLGAASASMMGYAVFFWLPSFLVRSYGMSLLDASLFFGAIILLGGIAGTWLGGYYADKLGAKNRSAYATVPATAFLLTIPFYLVAISTTNLTITFLALVTPVALGLMWLGPVVSAIQHVAKPHMRATASAIFLFINNLIGLGAGTFVIGYLSDAMRAQFGEDSLRYAIMSGTSLNFVAAVLMFIGARYLQDDWEEPAAAP